MMADSAPDEVVNNPDHPLYFHYITPVIFVADSGADCIRRIHTVMMEAALALIDVCSPPQANDDGSPPNDFPMHNALAYGVTKERNGLMDVLLQIKQQLGLSLAVRCDGWRDEGLLIRRCVCLLNARNCFIIVHRFFPLVALHVLPPFSFLACRCCFAVRLLLSVSSLAAVLRAVVMPPKSANGSNDKKNLLSKGSSHNLRVASCMLPCSSFFACSRAYVFSGRIDG
jgi:hypothetical protein